MDNVYPASYNDRDSISGASSAYQLKRKLTGVTYNPVTKTTRFAENVSIHNLDVDNVTIDTLDVTDATVATLDVTDTFQGVDASYYDGVTSNIQTQLDNIVGTIEADNWKQTCYVTTIINHTISSPGSIQGLNQSSTPSLTGKRILVKSQSTPSQNGIYIYATSTTPMTRSLDANTASELQFAKVALSSADPTQPGYIYYESLAITTLGTDTVTFININTGVPFDSIAPINLGNAVINDLAIKIGSGTGTGSGVNEHSIFLGKNVATVAASSKCIGIGFGALSNSGTESIAIGYASGFTSQGIHCTAIGSSSGLVQGIGSTALGYGAGLSQGLDCVAIGAGAGATQVGGAIAIGKNAAIGTGADDESIYIGINAGGTTKTTNCLIMGINSGLNSATGSIAMGVGAASTSQGTKGIAIGYTAGVTQGANAIAMGPSSSVAANSIVLNASGSNQNSAVAGFIANPVRQTAGTTPFILSYDTTNQEIIASSTTGTASGTNTGDVTFTNHDDLTLTGQALVIPAAGAATGGVLTTGAQSIAGVKTFTDNLNIASGKVYQINGTQITTAACSDTTAKATSTSNTAIAVVQSVTVTYTKVQNQVIISYPDISFTASSSGVLTWQLPTLSPSIFPITTLFKGASLDTGGTIASSVLTIDTSGLITWYRTTTFVAAFASGLSYVVKGNTHSYIC